MTLRIGTRGSALALWQAHHIRDRVRTLRPDTDVEIVVIRTTGDQILDRPLADIGGKGLFVKEIEAALLDGSIDLAVHSLKDMPTEQPDGLVLDAFPTRANPFDMLCCREAITSVDDLPRGARVGTGSARRGLQLQRQRPDITIVPLRGNVQTRLDKRHNDGLDAVILACAGLERLEMSEPGFSELPPSIVVPAPGQGALAIECREGDAATRALLAELDCPATRLATTMERACLDEVGGDCHTPFAAWARRHGDQLELVARLMTNGRFAEARVTEPLYDDGRDLERVRAAGRSAGLQLLAQHDPDGNAP